MTRYRKKPVVIEAMQYLGFNESGTEAELFLGDSFSCHAPSTDEIDIKIPGGMIASEGGRLIRGVGGEFYPRKPSVMIASKGDWLVKGVDGKFYPVKPDIFAATYRPEEL